MIKISTYIKVFFFIFIILVSNSLFAKKAAIVMDYETKEVLFEVNADTLNFPASLTKIMTLYIVFDYIHKDNLNWQTQLKVSKFAASESPSKLYLEAGTSISVEDAVMALIVKSANDVATVVAENISGTEKEFAKLMTSYARKLGMNKTTFKNAHGLPDRAQMTTARDMATLSSIVREVYMHLFAEHDYLNSFAEQIGAKTKPPIIGDLQPESVCFFMVVIVGLLLELLL